MKLIALDLDGTTLNSKKEMTEETILAIKKAQEQGHIVMALSGRTFQSVQSTLAKYELDCPIGGNNGTELFADGKLIELISLDDSQSRRIAFTLEKDELPYKISTNKGSFAPRDWSKRLEKVLTSGRVPKEYFENQHFKMFTGAAPEKLGQQLFDKIEEVFDHNELLVQKINILTFDPEQKKRLEQFLDSIEEINITGSSPFNLEIIHRNGNKGNGLKMMAQYFGIPLSETVAIGDERNDISMLQVAGLAIAMNNAEEEVKQHSHVVTLSNDENGVAYAIEKYILQDSYIAGK